MNSKPLRVGKIIQKRQQPSRTCKTQQVAQIPTKKTFIRPPKGAPLLKKSYSSSSEGESEEEKKKIEESPKMKEEEKKDEFKKVRELTGWIQVPKLGLLEAIKDEVKKGHRKEDEDQICPICRCELYDDLLRKEKEELVMGADEEVDVVRFKNCETHWIHKDCAEQLRQGYDFVQCPTCLHFYGIKTGDQPPGTMRTNYNGTLYCDGEKCGTHVISYHFPSGKKKDGTHYSGTSRVAYLPDNEGGREVLALLKEGFKRKVLFTIGTSVTTGQSNTVIWNGVHHKTSTTGGKQNIIKGGAYYGYPDDTYFNRVKEELASKGIYADQIEKKPAAVKRKKK